LKLNAAETVSPRNVFLAAISCVHFARTLSGILFTSKEYVAAGPNAQNACFVRPEGRARSTVTGDLLHQISDHTDLPRWIQLLPQGPIQMKYVASQLIGGVIEFGGW
jgi:hypothetical protein